MVAVRARLTLSGLAGFIAALLSAQTFRERVDVELVRVALIATDGAGHSCRVCVLRTSGSAPEESA
jgi:hypothetical protein